MDNLAKNIPIGRIPLSMIASQPCREYHQRALFVDYIYCHHDVEPRSAFVGPIT